MTAAALPVNPDAEIETFEDRATDLSVARTMLPPGYVILPAKASVAMLRPFYECPPEELDLAWQALVAVAEAEEKYRKGQSAAHGRNEEK